MYLTYRYIIIIIWFPIAWDIMISLGRVYSIDFYSASA